jgi:hypothetical protein
MWPLIIFCSVPVVTGLKSSTIYRRMLAQYRENYIIQRKMYHWVDRFSVAASVAWFNAQIQEDRHIAVILPSAVTWHAKIGVINMQYYISSFQSLWSSTSYSSKTVEKFRNWNARLSVTHHAVWISPNLITIFLDCLEM